MNVKSAAQFTSRIRTVIARVVKRRAAEETHVTVNHGLDMHTPPRRHDRPTRRGPLLARHSPHDYRSTSSPNKSTSPAAYQEKCPPVTEES